MTIRLPDLSKNGSGESIESSDGVEAADVAPKTQSLLGNPTTVCESEIVRDTGRAAGERVVAKVAAYIRQPKFWLACLTAISVQVVLAALMTPADDQGDALETSQPPAKRWSKPAASPAARIVVPPAQPASEASDSGELLRHGATTPLGAAAPVETSSDVAASTNGTSGNVIDTSLPATRLADNRRQIDDGRPFDGPAAPVEPATLGSIVPLESASQPNHNEQP